MLNPKFDEKGNLIIRMFTNDIGELITDIVCPIGCGRCCSYWSVVRELKCFAEQDPSREKCPYLRKKGCKLPRKRRPLECLIYTCELAALLLEGDHEITKEDIQRVLNEGKQGNAFSFLGIEPLMARVGMDTFFATNEKKVLSLIDKGKKR